MYKIKKILLILTLLISIDSKAEIKIKDGEVVINDFDQSLLINHEFEALRKKLEGPCISRPSTVHWKDENEKLINVKQTYCLWNENSKSNHVVYFFHGMLLTEKHWMKSEKNKFIAREWLKNLKNAPTVISVSYGPASIVNPEILSKFTGKAFLFSSKNEDAKKNSLLDDFQKDFMPYVEKKLKKWSIKRHLFSVSMGGFNSSQLLVRKPKKFKSAVFICPALNPKGPYSPYQMAKYYVQNRPKLKYYFYALYLSKYYFPKYRNWKKDSPLPLFKKSRRSFPPIYISASKQDEFGFYSGGKYFADLAINKGIDAHFSEEGEFHCDFTAPPIAEFTLNQFN